MSLDDFHRLAKTVSNWGRWGREDQRGTLNLITPQVLKRAASSVRQGKLFSLGLDFNRDGPQEAGPGRFNPHLYMTAVSTKLGTAVGGQFTSDDVVHMPLQCATQWDALAHVGYDSRLYNGFHADEVSVSGAAKLGIENVGKPGVVSRGILLDVARLKGVERLDRTNTVTPDDLERAKEAQGAQIEAGDIILVRTGHMTVFTKDGDRRRLKGRQPGLTMACAEWLHDHDAAAVAVDNYAVEALPSGEPDLLLPLHLLCLRDMGLIFGELFDLEALAADCAGDGQWDFLFTAPALPITGAVGAAINPLVLK